MQEYTHYLIIDVEATCCDQGTIHRKEMEIIEIGAVMVEASELSIVDDFVTFINPVRNPILTKFCTELTTIKQSDVDTAPKFPEAIQNLKEWMLQYENFLFCSWGDYDKQQFQQDCMYHQILYPFGAHLNIKKQFSETQQLKKKYGMAGALRKAGIPLEGTHHRGIDDARNMAKLMPYIVKR